MGLVMFNTICTFVTVNNYGAVQTSKTTKGDLLLLNFSVYNCIFGATSLVFQNQLIFLILYSVHLYSLSV